MQIKKVQELTYEEIRERDFAGTGVGSLDRLPGEPPDEASDDSSCAEAPEVPLIERVDVVAHHAG